MTANQNRSFADKVAFVTGAGSGIGRATALAFGREGASVVVAESLAQDVAGWRRPLAARRRDRLIQTHSDVARDRANCINVVKATFKKQM